MQADLPLFNPSISPQSISPQSIILSIHHSLHHKNVILKITPCLINTIRYICVMDKIASKAERTRSFIIESTAEIFNKKGYAGTSLSDLTEATGLTKGSIYGNFENKEEVALAVFDYNCSRISQITQQQIDQAKTYHEKLMVYASVYKKVGRDKVNHGGCPILNTATEADDTNGLLKDRAAKAVLRWVKNITYLIEQGIATGEFRADVDVQQTALSIVALIEGGVMISRVTSDVKNLDIVLKTVEMLIRQME